MRGDTAHLQAMLDVEVALAEALAAEGLIPATVVAAIRGAARAELYDGAALGARAAEAGNLAIPLIEQLTAQVASSDVNAARYVHWGATSQDILDTALVLELRREVPRIIQHIDHAITAAAAHARRHARLAGPGRTWLQHATPVTFGLKAAGWAGLLDRVRRDLELALEGAAVLQFGGASGTLAALGGRGLAVAQALGAQLGLTVPPKPWHTERDRLVHLASALGLVAGAMGKIGRDLALLAQTEVGEAREAAAPGRGGSSAMPHKQNPVAAAVAIAASIRAPALVAVMLAAMPQEHERGLGGWQAEWDTLPELVSLCESSARVMAEALEHLVVDAERMAANLDLTRGLLNAESVAMALAGQIGIRAAHDLVSRASGEARQGNRPLADVLKQDRAIMAHLTPEQIDTLLVPDRYLGMADTFIERVLASLRPDATGDA